MWDSKHQFLSACQEQVVKTKLLAIPSGDIIIIISESFFFYSQAHRKRYPTYRPGLNCYYIYAFMSVQYDIKLTNEYLHILKFPNFKVS